MCWKPCLAPDIQHGGVRRLFFFIFLPLSDFLQDVPSSLALLPLWWKTIVQETPWLLFPED